jgi:competence protein ComEC
MTTAYNFPAGKKRKKEANLFVGEWAERLETIGQETKVKFRGGMGYVPTDSIGAERTLEIYFIDVQQGDSILIQTADDRRILVDGGKGKEAYSFIKWKYNLKKYYKDFDAIIMTHGDADHCNGLFPLLNDEHVIVKRIYHNGIAKRKEAPVFGQETKINGKKMLIQLYDDIADLEPEKDKLTSGFQRWVEAVSKAKERAKKQGIECKCIRTDQNTEPLVFDGKKPLKISFLNPINFGSKNAPILSRFGSTAETINGNSVATLIEYGKAKILLCGDMNEKAEKLFLKHCKVGTPIAHVFKASHHGSQHFTSDFLKAVQPWISVVSSGDDPDYGHPRAVLLGSLGRYAPTAIEKPLLFSTEVAATFKGVKVDSKETAIQLYEKTNHGLINVRTNGEWLAAGRVYNVRKKKDGKYAKSLWDWEKYAFDLKNGKSLENDLLKT